MIRTNTNDLVSKSNINKKDEDFIDLDALFYKVAPYLSNPELIKDFLKKHISITRIELIKLIEEEILKSSTLQRTDFRILLNSI